MFRVDLEVRNREHGGLNLSVSSISERNDKEHDKLYKKASIKIIEQQLVLLENKIPIKDLQILNEAKKNNVELVNKILEKHLTKMECTEYHIWLWTLFKIQEVSV